MDLLVEQPHHYGLTVILDNHSPPASIPSDWLENCKAPVTNPMCKTASSISPSVPMSLTVHDRGSSPSVSTTVSIAHDQTQHDGPDSAPRVTVTP